MHWGNQEIVNKNQQFSYDGTISIPLKSENEMVKVVHLKKKKK